MVIIIITMIFTGCWDYSEYEDMAMVFSLGLDSGPGEDGLTMTIEYSAALPGQQGGAGTSGGQAGGTGQEIRQASGKLISSILDSLQEVTDRQIFLGYTRVVVINEDAAKKHMKEIISFFDTTSLIRNSTYILFSKEKAADVLATTGLTGSTTTSKRIEGLLSNSSRGGVSYPISIGEFFLMLSTEGMNPVAPQIIMYSAKGNESGKPGDLSENEIIPGTVKQTAGQHKISGLAAFNGYQWVGWLNERESRGWIFISNRVKKTGFHKIILDNLNSKDERVPVGFLIKTIKVKNKVKLINGKPEINVTVQLKTELSEYTYTEEFIKPDILKNLEERLAKSVKDDVEAAINKAQKELHTDIFGFGYSFFKQHTGEWRKNYKDSWNNIFPSVPVYVEVDAKILSTGPKGFSIKIDP